MGTKVGAVAVLLVLVAAMVGVGCDRIGAGHVGVRIDLAGSQRGVEDIPVRTGWVFYNRFTQQMFEYPVYVQTAVWTKSTQEGEPMNEEITFTTKDSLAVSADISLSYFVRAEAVPAFYTRFRSDDLNNFTHGYLRNVARDQFNETASHYNIESIMGDNEQFIKEVRARLQKEVDPIGIEIVQFGFIGAPRPPDVVIMSINAKVQATQLALQKQNEVLQAEADARKRVAAATGEARANEVLGKSITPQLLEWERIKLQREAIARWNGQRPQVEGAGSGLLLQVTPKEKQ